MRHSNYPSYNSPDGLPSSPWPMVPITVACKNEECAEDITTEICPYCGTENEIEYETDYGDQPDED